MKGIFRVGSREVYAGLGPAPPYVSSTVCCSVFIRSATVCYKFPSFLSFSPFQLFRLFLIRPKSVAAEEDGASVASGFSVGSSAALS